MSGRGDFRGGRGGGGDRGGFRGGDRGGFRGGDRGGFRGGDRGGFRGGDRGGFRGGDRGGRGGDRGRGGPGRARGGVFQPQGHSDTIDARLLDNSEDQLVQSLQKITLAPEQLPARPNFGTSGHSIKLRSNYFALKIGSEDLFEYEVKITPATDIKRIKRRIFQIAEKTPDWQGRNLSNIVAHDHSTKLIAAEKLPQPLVIRLKYYEEDEPTKAADKQKEFTVTINYARTLETASLHSFLDGQANYKNYDVMPILSAYNIILAAYPNRGGKGILVGNNRFFFENAAPPKELGGGLVAWRGFYSSVRPAHKQLQVNVNVCTTAFYKSGLTLIDLVERERVNLTQGFVRGLRVKATHLGFVKSIKRIYNKNASQHRFDHATHGNISVADYFFKEYKIKLRRPELPLVDVKGGERPILIPQELLQVVPNQPFRGKLSDDATAEMILAACQPPNVNAAAIIDTGLKELGYQDNGLLKSFKVDIARQMVVVPGRILAPPVMQYGDGRPFNPKTNYDKNNQKIMRSADPRASWNLRGVRFIKPAQCKSWCILALQDGGRYQYQGGGNDPELREHINHFIRDVRAAGVDLPNPTTALTANVGRFVTTVASQGQQTTTELIRTTLANHFRQPNAGPRPELVLVILPSADKNLYGAVKKVFDTIMGVASICMQAQKFRKDNTQYNANVSLKLNMKMGGVNHILYNDTVDRNNVMSWFNQQKTMLIGMDVTHPGPGTVKGAPSIAAVVGSVDQYFGQYPSSLRVQDSRQEMIVSLTEMIVERLQAFQRLNNGLPQRIIVYRDGVSEGQYQIVKSEELPCIKAAFKQLGSEKAPYNPLLTVIVCGKRHHTRFFPTSGEAVGHNNQAVLTADKDGNPVPGTVVDRGVTAVYEYDFFLQAHGGLQGTTKPTHYYVVHDEIKLTADYLQNLTNCVSYTFARATKAVSLAAPAYYADLAAERGRFYLSSLSGSAGPTQVTSAATGGGVAKDEAAIKADALKEWGNGIAAALKETMFYL